MTHLLTLRLWLTGGLALILLSLPGFSMTAPTTPRLTNDDWKNGVVVLEDERVLNGKVYYDYLHDLVLLRPANKQSMMTFTARQVQSFRYYDPQENIIHDFLALDHHPRLPYPVRSFYEVVTTGEVLYLRRHNRCPVAPPRDVSPHKVAFTYFAYYQGQLVRARQFERNLLPMLLEKDPTLSRYAKEHRLRPYDVGDQILLVDYFNQPQPKPVAHRLSS